MDGNADAEEKVVNRDDHNLRVTKLVEIRKQ